MRRLIHETGSVTQISVPAGDSTSQPGWDGELLSDRGNAWVPLGKSFWELSCEQRPTQKANSDYSKRTKSTPAEVRAVSTLVVLTGRKWANKRKWLKEKKELSEWSEIRAYDADDLEQWFEMVPAVKLQFGDDIGLTGYGVSDIRRHWATWAQQSDVVVTPEAFLVGREVARDAFIASVRSRLERGSSDPVSIRADSAEEAAAFAAATLMRQEDLSSVALIVTAEVGWRFVEQNTGVRVAIAARPELAERPTCRSGTVVVIPYATGDMASYFRGVASRDGNDASEIALERPDRHEFEKALVDIGVDSGDASRLSVTTGRSWSVFRRRRAINPAIRRPAWLEAPETQSLSTVCLLGGWLASNQTDRSIVSHLSQRDYEQIERDLRYLSKLDDAPILEIGDVWKAKAPLELLDILGERITRSEMDRFFQISGAILEAHDPVLDLPEEHRHAAQIYGKVRPESGVLIRSVSDTLVKLAVRGSEVSSLAAANVEVRVANLIRRVLFEADKVRWLSLSSILPDLAEAAPEAFLEGIEASLAKPDAPVLSLLSETSGSGLMGRCWHAGLLWAFERIAWAPQRLGRVALLLARFSAVEIKGNWANSPKATILNLFRSWLPQTAANLEQRIAVLDLLMRYEPDVAFDTLEALSGNSHHFATPSDRPNWRDEDSGAGRGVVMGEHCGMLVAATDRMILSARGHASRVARIIERVHNLDTDRASKILLMAQEFADPAALDISKELIRAAIRRDLNWRKNYGKADSEEQKALLRRLEDVYQQLEPGDLIVRYAWLFEDSSPALPIRTRGEGQSTNYTQLAAERLLALEQIYARQGFDGLMQFAKSRANAHYVGATIAKMPIDDMPIPEVIVRDGGDFTPGSPLYAFIRGLLGASAPDKAVALIEAVLGHSQATNWCAERIARFLTLAENSGGTWRIVEKFGNPVSDLYWTQCEVGSWYRHESTEFITVLQRLVDARRPRSALQVCRFDFGEVPPLFLAVILEALIDGQEGDGPLPEPYTVGEALDQLEQSGALEADRLVRIGFGLIPALGYQGEHHAVSLYAKLMSDPQLFVELLCLVYKSTGETSDEDVPEEAAQLAKIAWHIFDACQRMPGTKTDGRIDPIEVTEFVTTTRRLANEAGRLDVCDSTLGQIFAHAPKDSNGIWPTEAICDILDLPELDKMRQGFVMGVMNKRGVTSRASNEGGEQERELANVYREYARAIDNSHIQVAASLNKVAEYYENYGLREDIRARARREGY